MAKKITFLIIISIILLSSIGFADRNYEILSYTVNAKVNQNAVIDIEEIISVNFKQQRHGIYRDIPIHYNGYDHKVSNIKVVDPITNDEIPFKVEKSSNKVRIIIGSADKYVFSDVNYKIMYSFDYGDNLDNRYDSIYFNFIGHNWNSPIPISKVNIEMPKSFDKNELFFTTGKYKSEQNSNVEYEVFGNTIEANVGYLYPYEGITLRLKLPDDYFTNESLPYSRYKFIFLIGSIIAVIIGSLFIGRKNKDQNTIIPILSFNPPYELNPAELSYIYYEEILDKESVVTLVLYWASKGYLNIIEQNGVMTYENRISPETISDNAERNLYEAMFDHGDGSLVKESQLKEVFYADIKAYINDVREKYSGEKDVLIDSYQSSSAVLMLVLAFVVSVFTARDLAAQLGIGSIFAGVGMFVVLLISHMVITAITMKIRLKGMKRILGISVMIFITLMPILVLFLFVVSNGFGNTISLESFEFSIQNGRTMWVRLVTITYLLSLVALWSILQIRKISPFAKKRLNKIYGFKEFLEKAKVDEIKSVYYDNPSYYYDMLPYVMVFGFTKIWSEHAKELAMEKPDWYTSNTGSPFDSYVFYKNFDKSMAIATSTPEPQGGGSDGDDGGFSGGGFS